MNYSLRGKLIVLEPTRAVIDVNGLGFELRIPLRTFTPLDDTSALHQNVTLYVYQHITETSLTYYGFFSMAQRNLFIDLLSVRGVGPTTALSALSYYHHSDLKTIIASQNLNAICAIHGIGEKTGNQILLDLGAKYEAGESFDSSVYDDAVKGLVALGCSKKNAGAAVKKVLARDGQDSDVSHVILESLKII